jgi:hypothetical protein
MKRVNIFLSALILGAFVALNSCSEKDFPSTKVENQSEKSTTSDRTETQPVVLGDQKENPFSVDNMKTALELILSQLDDEDMQISRNSAGSMLSDLPTTDLYVRFLPADTAQFMLLFSDESLQLFDFPLDYEILQHGDYYKDPELENSEYTWFYAVVKPDYIPPEGVQYEVVEELFIPENSEYYTEIWIDADDMHENNESVKLPATEQELEMLNLLKAMLYVSFEMTGNGDDLISGDEQSTGISQNSTHKHCYQRCIKVLFKKICWTDCDTYYHPDGHIRLNIPNGTNVGVPGIKVRVWRWFTIETTTTDANGYYRFPQRFDKLLVWNDLNYKILFEGRHPNGVNWNINRSLFGAACLWTDGYGMGLHSPNGYTKTFFASNSYWGKLVLHNAIYDYCTRARADGISQPPPNLEIAVKNSTDFTSSAPLLRSHINLSIIKAMPNVVGVIGQIYAYSLFGWAMPDLILRYTNTISNYDRIRNVAWHELTHASQLQRMKNEKGLLWASDYWSQNVYQQAKNDINSGSPYGAVGGDSWQIIALSEGWAEYRVDPATDGSFPSNYARMFNQLAAINISQSEMERALCTWTITGYRDNLIARYPNLRTQITNIVNQFLQ